jgi:glycyl-tRNA synthetase
LFFKCCSHPQDLRVGDHRRRQVCISDTPYCVTVDYETLGDSESGTDSDRSSGRSPGDGDDADRQEDTVTLRERDTTAQKRVPIDGLAETLDGLVAGEITFDEL